MAGSSVTTSLPMWMTGQTYDGSAGNDLRNSGVTPLLFDPGIASGSVIGIRGGVLGGAGLQVSAASGMNVSVQPGSFAVPVTGSPSSGGYLSTLAQSATLSVTAASSSNPRIDIVCAGVTDTGTTGSSGWVQVITGSPAATPAPPSAPANSITVAQVLVPASATSIVAGDITDTRPFTCTAGGVPVVAKNAVAGYNGQLAYDGASGSFYHNAHGGSLQARVKPWAPVTVRTTATWIYPASTPSAVLSTNVTLDGSTDLKVTYHVNAIAPYAGATVTLSHQITVGGTVIDQTVTAVSGGTTSDLSGGFTGVAYTSAAMTTTPAAGTKSVVFQAWTGTGGGGYPQMRGTSGFATVAWMRVEPVSL